VQDLLGDLLGENIDADAVEVPTEPVVSLPRSHRGRRLAVMGAQQSMRGMAGLEELLGVDPSSSLVVSPSFAFFCTFEWGAPSVVQTACATESFLG